jgi:DNA invertase Pin-like site-specific DNA recombinase
MLGNEAGPGDGDPVIHAIEEMLEANRGLQQVLKASEARMEQYLRLLNSGVRAVDLARSYPAVTARIEDNEAIDRLTRTRQRSRAATFRRLIEEGMTRKEIAEGWGFSQQVVSRIVNYEDIDSTDSAR